ncbi:MAG TPA: YegS/Rv2252/BmrU family lipid kinase [Acholeplasma sp.]
MKVYVVFNSNAGRGLFKYERPHIEDFFKRHQITYTIEDLVTFEHSNGEFEQIIKDYDVCIIAGGDGTVHSVVNKLMNVKKEVRPKVLILPFGTTNDTATMLGMRKKLDESLSLLLTENYYNMDLYKANDTYFVYAAAIGKFSKISYEINRQHLRFLGSIGYFLNMIRDLFNHYRMDVKIHVDGKTIEKKTFLILMIAGNQVAGFRLKHFSSIAKLNDRQIGVRIFTRNHIFSWFKMVWFYLFRGHHFKNDLHLNVKEIEIEIDPKYTWNIDGEKGMSGSLKLKVEPKALKVYASKKTADQLFIKEDA